MRLLKYLVVAARGGEILFRSEYICLEPGIHPGVCERMEASIFEIFFSRRA